MLTASMAQDAETPFGLSFTTPADGASVAKVEYIQLCFTKEVTVTLPTEPIIIKNNDTNVEYKIANGFAAGPNAIFYVQKVDDETVVSISATDDDGNINSEALGTYGFTIPAGCIASVDGEAFEGQSFTFSVSAPLSIVSYSPITGVKELSKIELTFSEEVASVNTASMNVVDGYWSNWYNIANAVISDDKMTVTLELETPITTIDNYTLMIYGGAFTSVSGSTNVETYLNLSVIDPTPSFYTNYDDNNRVKEIPGLAIGFKNVNNVELVEGAEPVMVYLPGGSDAAGTAEIIEGSIIVTFDTELTEEGLYTFVIPAGMFTMDGVENEAREVGVELYTFNIVPLEVISITPAAGTVEQLDKIIIQFNQNVSLAMDENLQQISREIKMTDGENEYTLTYNPMPNLGTSIEYLVNAEWTGYEYASTPITAEGRYVLDLSAIVVSYAGEKYMDEWGYENTRWNAQGSCEGTVTWTVSADATGIDGVEAEEGEQVIYDLTGRRVKSITKPGIYIVNGAKVVK